MTASSRFVALREVPVERAGADAGALGDLVERGVVPLLAEDLARDLDDAVVVALGIGAHGTSPRLALLNGDSLRIVVEEAEPSSGSRVPRPTRPEQDLLSMSSTILHPTRRQTRPVDLPAERRPRRDRASRSSWSRS